MAGDATGESAAIAVDFHPDRRRFDRPHER